MHHILVAVDGSDWSQVAASYALDFARPTREEVVALAVIPPKAMQRAEALSGSGERTLESLARSDFVFEVEHLGQRAVNEWFANTEQVCESEGLCFARALDVGKPAEQLVWAAMTARMCVLGAHGADRPDSGRGLGRVATTVVRQAIKPLLVTREQYRPIQRVLLGWDGRPEAAHALEMLLEPAKAHGWAVTVAVGAETVEPVAQQARHIAQELQHQGVAAEAYVTPGNAPHVIFEVVDKLKPDLVAIGARRRGAGEALLGGSWWDLVEQLQVPVLMYR